MNIIVCTNLLLFAFVSVCLTASLTDDQLAQIIEERLQPDALIDSRDYARSEDINEFKRRIAALEKIDDVADELFPENVPEEYGEGGIIASIAKGERNPRGDKVNLDDSKFDRDINRKAFKRDTSMLSVDAADTAHGSNDGNILSDCIKGSKTDEDLTECLKTYQVPDIKNEFKEIEEKRNPFCGRYGCVSVKRNTATDHLISENSKSSCIQISETLKDFIECIKSRRVQKNDVNALDIIKDKRNPFCGRYGCGRKRSGDLDSNDDSKNSPEDCFHGSKTELDTVKCLNAAQKPKNEEATLNSIHEKRNPICGRYKCSERREVKRLFCNRYGCGRSARKSRKAADLLFVRDKIAQITKNSLYNLIKNYMLASATNQDHFKVLIQRLFLPSYYVPLAENKRNQYEYIRKINGGKPSHNNSINNQLINSASGSNQSGMVKKVENSSIETNEWRSSDKEGDGHSPSHADNEEPKKEKGSILGGGPCPISCHGRK